MNKIKYFLILIPMFLFVVSCTDNGVNSTNSPIISGHYYIQSSFDPGYHYHQYLVFTGGTAIEFAEYGYEYRSSTDSDFFQIKRTQGDYYLSNDSIFVEFFKDTTVYRYGGLLKSDYKPFPFQTIPKGPYVGLPIKNVTTNSIEIDNISSITPGWKILPWSTQPQDVY